MLEAVDQRLNKCSMNDKKAARSSVALILYLMEKLCSVTSPEGTQVAEQIAQMQQDCKQHIQMLLKHWIMRDDVIGGSMFGGGGIDGRSVAEIKASAS